MIMTGQVVLLGCLRCLGFKEFLDCFELREFVTLLLILSFSYLGGFAAF